MPLDLATIKPSTQVYIPTTFLHLPPSPGTNQQLNSIHLMPSPAPRRKRPSKPSSWVGLIIGFITGVVVSTGPINAPFFLAYGLVKGAYLGTEAMGSLAVYVAKAITFRSLDALPVTIIAKGLIIGSSLVAGAFIAKRIVHKIDNDKFKLMMDGLLLLAGLTMLWAAFLH